MTKDTVDIKKMTINEDGTMTILAENKLSVTYEFTIDAQKAEKVLSRMMIPMKQRKPGAVIYP